MPRADLGRLLEELVSEPGYATGQRAFPRRIGADDVVAIVEALHEQLDGGTAGRARAAAAGGMPLACGRGCAGCCEEPIVVFLPEALIVGRWLAWPENAAARQHFLDGYAAWRAAAGEWPDTLPALSAGGDLKAHKDAHIAGWRLRNRCGFLDDDGACTIYPVRPTVCRNAHAVETSAHCGGDSLLPASRLTYKPLDDYVELTRRVFRAAHHALGGPTQRPAALCVTVKELLTKEP